MKFSRKGRGFGGGGEDTRTGKVDQNLPKSEIPKAKKESQQTFLIISSIFLLLPNSLHLVLSIQKLVF